MLSWISKRRSERRGFTLIELLIVIAIILILIAIALPNFLEAQIRAKVTKAKGEIRTLGTAMEMYYLDFKTYPAETEGDFTTRPHGQAGHTWLTQPIKYITSVPEDPFPSLDLGEMGPGRYVTYESGGVEQSTSGSGRCFSCMVTWVIYSRGPSHNPEPKIRSADPNYQVGGDGNIVSYSPTNGTVSEGTIHWWGGDGFFIGIQAGSALQRSAPPVVYPSFAPGLPVNYTSYLHRLPPNFQ